MSRNKVVILSLLALMALIAGGYFLLQGNHDVVVPGNAAFQGNALEVTLANYGEDVKEYADEFDLSYEYLMALIVLETSGKKPAGKRFEQGVYNRLLQVKSGDRRKYENIRQSHLEEASDGAVRNLATSWGPFQLMGYKCIGMDVNVSDIRGEDGLYYGMSWINDEYGRFVRKSNYKDAFHYHNTGRKYPTVGKPRTHDPRYVEKGLSYMEFFRQNRP
ncbi:MAG: hypothetical protein P8O05_09135 [Flavobacteriales bacterium]|nr:hypothetical protein [Flavobacteriales bacterium]